MPAGLPSAGPGPATPVEILGLDGVPEAGDKVAVVDSEKRARDIVDYRQRKRRDQAQVAATGVKSSLEEMFSQLRSGDSKELPVVIIEEDVIDPSNAHRHDPAKLATARGVPLEFRTIVHDI